MVYHINFIAGFLEVSAEAALNHSIDEIWMGLIADFEHIFFGYDAEAAVGCLKVVESVSHISFSCEDEGFEAFIIVLDFLHSHDFFESVTNFFVTEFCESDNCTSRLNWLNDFA